MALDSLFFPNTLPVCFSSDFCDFLLSWASLVLLGELGLLSIYLGTRALRHLGSWALGLLGTWALRLLGTLALKRAWTSLGS
jgi:hypothetical protein